MASHSNLDDFVSGIEWIRKSVKGLAEIPNIEEAGWDIANDPEFWVLFNQIEQAGIDCNTEKALWLVEFTQIDDLGPMGRALFLARAALLALSRMPCAALEAAESAQRNLADDASIYRKVGICKSLAASGMPSAAQLIEVYVKDPQSYVSREAEWALRELNDNL